MEEKKIRKARGMYFGDLKYKVCIRLDKKTYEWLIEKTKEWGSYSPSHTVRMLLRSYMAENTK